MQTCTKQRMLGETGRPIELSTAQYILYKLIYKGGDSRDKNLHNAYLMK